MSRPSTVPAAGQRAAASRRRLLPGLGLGLTALLVLSACGASPDDDTSPQQGAGTSGAASSEQAAPSDVVAMATTTQLGSVLEQITQCAGTTSTSVMGPGDDPHDFSASSQQVAQMTTAEVVFANGLGLEAGMDAALANAEADGATIVEIAPQLDPLPFAAHDGHAEDDGHDHAADDRADEAHSADDGHDHGPLDPHVWMDVGRMATAAELMGQELAEATGDQSYTDCAQTVHDELTQTDETVREIIAQIPEDRRTLVTDHAAYNYFADAYGIEVSGVVIPGGATDAEPSSQELAALVQQIRDAGADALLTSLGAGGRMLQTVAQEVGDVPVVELYEGGVGPEGSGAETYAKAMEFNATALAEALR